MSNQLPSDIVLAMRRLSQALSDPTQLMVRAGDSFESALIKLAVDRIKESNNLTLQLITHVFEVWENEYRDDPSSFLTPDECAALEVATLSEQRAIYFTAIFRNLGYQTALIREVVREVIAEPVQQIVSQVSQTREQWLAVREGHFNAAAEEYFSARPHLDTPEIRRVFYAGHCKGYDAAPEAPVQDDFKAWYEDAMSASNEAGFVGVSAAATIRELARQVTAAQEASAQPIDMILYCPACGMQHIDAPDHPYYGGITTAEGFTPRWDNPPHRSHLCDGCKYIWRPADVPTNGVAAIKTKGKADSPAPEAPAPATERHLRRLLAVRVGMPHAYYDDGEAHGTEHGIQIDFMREPVADIDAKLRALNVARAADFEKRDCALNPADVHVQVLYKSDGGFNPTVENGVRLTHMPTGIYAECQSEMSKHANREAAWKRLERKVAAKTSPYYISGPYTTGEHAGEYGVAEVNTGRVVHFFKPCEFPTCAPHHPCTKPCFRNSGEKQ